MNYNVALLSIVFVPTGLAFLLPLIGKLSRTLRNVTALLLVLLPLAFSVLLIPAVAAGKALTLRAALPFGLDFVLIADGLAVFMACVSSLVSAVIVFYSFDYISHYENQGEYYFMVVLFLGGMMGLVFSGNLIFLYLFWEITAITSWRLIGFFREPVHVRKADKAFLVTVFGALCMLAGFLSIYQQAGSFDLIAIRVSLASHPLTPFAAGMILIGILSKSATLPFHTWLPDAGVAPSPVTALLHAAVLVKIGVYVFARFFVATFALPAFWHSVFPWIAAASALVSAGAALVETDLKRLIAYSTVSQIGFIFWGFAIGNEMAVAGSLLFILTHGLAKAGLFLCAGIVEQNTKIKDISKLGGLIRTMPVTAVSFLACAFSVMGIPPFGGFFSKYMVFAGAVTGQGRFWVTGLFLGCAFLTILYLLRVFYLVFLGEVRFPLAKERSGGMVFSVAFLSVLSLASGILICFPAKFASLAASQMLGIVK